MGSQAGRPCHFWGLWGEGGLDGVDDGGGGVEVGVLAVELVDDGGQAGDEGGAGVGVAEESGEFGGDGGA